MNHGVRPATPADGDGMRCLRRERAEENGWHGESADFTERFNDWLEAEAGRRRFWVADDDGAIVGMVNLAIFRRMPSPRPANLPQTWGYLGNLWVKPPYRGSGMALGL